jgi:hypothetical protein
MIEWKIKGLYKANAETIYNEIMSIGETVKPSDVVELARDENTALHDLFTWDDSIAAEKYREHEAGCIIRNIVVVEKDDSDDNNDGVITVRAIMSTNERTKEYTTVQRVVTNKDSYSKLLAAALAELNAFKKKYKTLSGDLEVVFSAIEQIAS